MGQISSFLTSIRFWLIVAVLVSILAVFGVYFLSSVASHSEFDGWDVISYSIEGRNLRVMRADTEEKHQRGLMYYKTLPKDIDGMLFIFEDRVVRSFWNKNTLMDLKLSWIDGEKVIGTSILPAILDGQEPTTVSSSGSATAVLEEPLHK